MGYFDKFEFLDNDTVSTQKEHNRNNRSYFDRFEDLTENTVKKRGRNQSYFDRFDDLDTPTQETTPREQTEDASYFDKFKQSEITSTTINGWGDLIKFGTSNIANKLLRESIKTSKLAAQSQVVGGANLASSFMAGTTAFTESAPTISEFKQMPAADKLRELSKWTNSPFLPYKILPRKTEEQIDKALIAVSDLLERTVPKEWSESVSKASDGELSDLNTWVANMGQQVPLYASNLLLRGTGQVLGGPLLGEVFSYGGLSLIETGSFLKNPQLNKIDSSIKEKWAARYGPASGAIEYIQEAGRIGHVKEIFKDIGGTSLKGILKRVGAESLEELSQDELQQAFTIFAIEEHNQTHGDNIPTPKMNHKKAFRAGALGAGMGLFTMGGGVIANATARLIPKSEIKTPTQNAAMHKLKMGATLKRAGYNKEQINHIHTIADAIVKSKAESEGINEDSLWERMSVSLSEPSKADDVLNQFIPVKEGKNVLIAEEMRKKGSPLKEIWQKTGLSYAPYRDGALYFKELDYENLKIKPDFYKNFDVVPEDINSLSSIDKEILADRLSFKYGDFIKLPGVDLKNQVESFLSDFASTDGDKRFVPLDQVLDWPELFNEVPGLKSWGLRTALYNKDLQKSYGATNAYKKAISILAKNENDFRSHFHHELTHAIAKELNLERGGSPKIFEKIRSKEEIKAVIQTQRELDRSEKKYKELLDKYPNNKQHENRINKLLSEIRNSHKILDKMELILNDLGERLPESEHFNYYKRLWGEFFARLTSARSLMTRKERTEIPPINEKTWKKVQRGDYIFRKGYESPLFKGVAKIKKGKPYPTKLNMVIADTNDVKIVMDQISEGKRKGAISFKNDGEVVFHALKNSDVSTAIHELGHLARRWSVVNKDDIKTIEEWAGVKNGEWTTTQEEKFARAFERYVRTGRAPKKSLTTTFKRMKVWLTKIYRKIKGSEIDVPISKEVRKVFDNIFLKSEEKKIQPIIKKSFKITDEFLKEVESPAINYDEIENLGLSDIVETNNIQKYFTRFSNLSKRVQSILIKFEEKRNSAAKLSAQISYDLFKDMNQKEMEEFAVAIEMREQFNDPSLRLLEKIFLAQQEAARKIYKEHGIDLNWPDNRIKRLEGEIQKLTNKKDSKNKEINEERAERIATMTAEINQIKNIRYVRRAVSQKRSFLGALFGIKPKITRKPAADIVAKRKFPTRESVKKAGYNLKSILESHAEYLHKALLFKYNNDLLDAIDKNEELSLPAKDAPDNWRILDPNTYPKRANKKYAPEIVEAFEELTSTRTDKTAYDKLNNALKLIGFYNPLIMTKNDLFQGWRLGGIKFFSKIKEAEDIWKRKGHLYNKLKEYGLFNNVLLYTPGADQVALDMYNQIKLTKGDKTAKFFNEALNAPVDSLLKNMQYFNNKYTWNIDEILRIASYLALKDTNFQINNRLSDFEIAEKANDFMANYGKVPKKTRSNLNRLIFTPTYKISMMRVLGQMWKQPARYRAQLFRHYSYKLFVWYVLPQLLAWKILGDPDKGRGEKGYKIILDTGYGKEKVYTLSDPLLEEAKLTQRPLLTSLERNLAAVPHAVFSLIRPSFYAKYKKPGDSQATRYMRYASGAFKLGAPFWREFETLSQKDLNKAEKLLSLLGVSYIYTRKKKKTRRDKENAAKSFAKALSIWIDLEEQKKDINYRIGIKND